MSDLLADPTTMRRMILLSVLIAFGVALAAYYRDREADQRRADAARAKRLFRDCDD